MTTVVEFRTIHFQRAEDLSEGIELRWLDIDESATIDGQIEHFAGGRSEIVIGETDVVAERIVLPWVDRTSLRWLKRHRGELLLMRDSRGRKIWGTFFALSASEHRQVDRLRTVVLTFEHATYTEGDS